MGHTGKIEPLYPEGSDLIHAQGDDTLLVNDSPVAQVEDDAVCEIFIRCTKPESDGQMRVTMEYTGDLQLAGFLIQHAQEIIEEQSQKTSQ